MGLNRKRLVFFSRLLVIITIGYILVLTPGREAMRFWGYAFLAFYLSTNLILYYLPERYFNRPAFFYCIVLVDCILIVAGIYLTGMEGSDLYLVFFVILCLATLGSELKNLIIASFIFVIIYGWLLYQQGLLQGDMATSYCLRLPFILVVALFWGFIVDIQKRVQKEQLEETEEQYRSFINKLPVGTFQHAAGENGRFLLMNRAFVEMFGYDTKELEKTPAAAIYAEQKQKEFLYRALDEQGHVEGYPADLLRRDGSVFNSNIWARKYTVNEHEVVEGIIVDISELRQAERALAES